MVSIMPTIQLSWTGIGSLRGYVTAEVHRNLAGGGGCAEILYVPKLIRNYCITMQ